MTEKFPRLFNLNKATGFSMSSYFQTYLSPLVVNPFTLPVSLFDKTSSKIVIQDQQKLALVIEVKPFHPTELTQEFLKTENIIPPDWKLKKPVRSDAHEVQFNFEKGVSILSRFNQLIITENIDSQNLDKMLFSTVANLLIEKLKNKKYSKIKFEFQRSFSISKIPDFGLNYFRKKIISPIFSQRIKDNLIAGEVSYRYELKHCKLNLKIKAFEKQNKNKLAASQLVFISSFNYKLENCKLQFSLEQLKIIITNWQLDYQNFINLINNQFLG